MGDMARRGSGKAGRQAGTGRVSPTRMPVGQGHVLEGTWARILLLPEKMRGTHGHLQPPVPTRTFVYAAISATPAAPRAAPTPWISTTVTEHPTPPPMPLPQGEPGAPGHRVGAGKGRGSHCHGQQWVPLCEGARGDTQGLHLSAQAFGGDAVGSQAIVPSLRPTPQLAAEGLREGTGQAGHCRSKEPALGGREPAPLLSPHFQPWGASPECPAAQRGPALPPGCHWLRRAPLHPAQEEGR